MPTDISEYYRILGVTERASLADIKQAYRVRAMHLHPDRNSSPDAHEQFVQLNEAYQFLLNYKQGKTGTGRAQYQQKWEQTERKKARERGNEYARMRWEEYYNSDDYKTGYSLDVIMTHVLYMFMWLILIAVPVGATIGYGVEGLLTSLFPMAILGWFLLFKVKEENKIDFKLFSNAANYIVNTIGFYTFLGIIFNMLVFFKIGLQTLVPFNVFPAVILIPAFAINIITFIKKYDRKWRLFYSYALWPFVVSLFFTVNFVFSNHVVEEKYAYLMTTQNVRGGHRGTNYVILEGNAYAEYPGIRYFFSFEEVEAHNAVLYTFADGLFGLRVVKHYEFIEE